MKKIIQTLTSLIFAISLVQSLHVSKSEGITIATAAGIAILAAFNNNSCENISDYKNYTVEIEMFTVPGNQKTFSQEILYSGIEGNILHLQYREFFGKYIRNTFTQNITYDLSKGHLIRLKRFIIDIIDANNTKITYIIKN